MTYQKPLPQTNADNKPFWDGCRQHQLRFQKCENCGHVRWPPAVICPICHSSEMKWIVAGGKGKVYSFAICHQAFHEAFVNDLPYLIAIVQLEEGPHMLTNIVGCIPKDVHCDMPVEVIWDDITDEFSLPKFKPAS